jgi:3-oxoacyl-[acyl-carrier-protein] synthase III
MAGIIYSDYYLPKDAYPVSDFLMASRFKYAQDEDFCECFASQSKQKKICIEKNLDEIGIFDVLLEKYFSGSGTDPSGITHLIYTSPENWSRNQVYIPYYLQTKFRMYSAAVIGLVQECVTTLQSMQVASSLIESGNAGKVMILSVCYGRPMEERYTGTTVVGDGAGMIVMGSENVSSSVVCCRSFSDGRYSYSKYRNMAVKTGGQDMVKRGVEFISNFLSSKQMTVNDVKLIIPQNINFSEYHMYARYLNIDIGMFFHRNISFGGHMAEVDVIRNYTDIIEMPLASRDDHLLFYGSGTIGGGMDAVYNAVLVKKH